MAKKINFEDEMIDSLVSSFTKKSSNATAGYVWQSSANIKQYISTGNPILDMILSNKRNGGWPVGRLSEIAGGEGAGKSLLAAYALKNTQEMDGVAILIDTEHAASMEVLEEVGVDVKKLVYLQIGTVEDVFAAMETIVGKVSSAGRKKDTPITIVWDSVAATSTKAEVEGNYEQQTIAMAARIISKGLRKYIPICSVHNVCLIFTNQLRANIGTFGHGDKTTTPGGAAIPFHASIRLRLSHYKKISDPKTKDMMGREIKCEVKKNKIAPPMRTTYHTIRWGERPGAWFDIPSTLWEAGITSGVFKKVTAMKQSFETADGKTVEFTKKSFADLIEDKNFYEELIDALAGFYIITPKNAPTMEDAIKEDVDSIEGE